MKLKVKFLKLSAGRPVAILHRKFAERSSIHVDDRVLIKRNNKKIIAVVDVATGMLKENEIAVSTEISDLMNLKQRNTVEVEVAIKPESLGFIYKKLEGKQFTRKEIKQIIQDIVNNNLTESEIAYFVSGVYKHGMTMREIIDMTKAVIETGKKLGLRGKVVEKHGIGGIPGRITPIIVSICASIGLLMPKTSSRAITSPSGTADSMEVICKVDFSIPEIRKIIKKTNACLVWGGSLNLAPADDKIIQVERLLNLDPEAQLLASIMAKKLAVNAKYVLIDIPYGKNAKVTFKEGKNIEKKFKLLGKHFNLKLECFLSKTEEPLGNGIGPALEISDVIKVLRREDSCYKLEQRALELAGKLLEMTGKVGKGRGIEKARETLNSGLAYKKFKQIVKAQKGNLNRIRKAKYKYNIRVKKAGRISEINVKEMNSLARIAGCPLDKYAGLYLYKHLNDKVKKNEIIMAIYSESQAELKEAIKYYKKIKPIKFK